MGLFSYLALAARVQAVTKAGDRKEKNNRQHLVFHVVCTCVHVGVNVCETEGERKKKRRRECVWRWMWAIKNMRD